MYVLGILLVFCHGLCPLGETPGVLHANKTDTLLGVGRTLVPNEVN